VLTLDLLGQLTQLSLLAKYHQALALVRTWRLLRTEIELALPIYKLQPADSTKFPRVVSNKRQIMLKSNRRDLQIVRSDQCTISFQLSANLGTSMRAGIVEWQRDEGSQEYIKLRMFACWVRTALSAMAKLIDDHRTKHDIRTLTPT